ncbi:MAG TPA: acetate--CoA ligase family protein [Streptosporangiaceae bacterium]|nr:acetate--CoA ligase family protein [Streptosporangiaceae bacterium]
MRALFHPRSIALVGATDKSGWSVNTFANLRLHEFGGPVYLVNPRTEVVHGDRAYRSLSGLPGPVDLAYVMVPTAAVLDVLREGADAGTRAFVILTAGFGETGPEGARREAEIVAFARERGLTVLGPNGNGYINAAAGITPYGLPIPVPLLRGPVGVVLQSGGLASAVLSFAQARNLGISLLVSMGNESMLSVTDVVNHLIDDPATRVITLFLESIRQPAEFAAAARRALAAGKPIVALKVGRSDIAQHTAQAHTGALTGDDAVIEAVFRQLGVVRVRSLEDLIITSGVLAELLARGPLAEAALAGNRLGVVTPSGGASEIIADRAGDEGLAVPPFAPATAQALKAMLPAFADVANPLDVTGYVVVDRTLLGRALEIVVTDPGLDVVLLLADPLRDEPPDPALARAARGLFEANARRIAGSPTPVVVVSNALTDITPAGRRLLAESGYPYVAGGIEHGMTAIGAAVRWSRAWRDRSATERSKYAEHRLPGSPGPIDGTGTWAEDRAAGFLASRGVPVVPRRPAGDEAAAVAAAAELGYPVVVKAGGLAHKSDTGGVRLNLADETAVRQAYRAVREVAGGGTVLVQPYRTGGVELITGIVRDPAWGLMLAVGLGGIWVEVLQDAALRPLPVSADEVAEALAGLRGAAVLRGARGAPPADLPRVAAVIADIAAVAAGLGDRLESLEVNPLLVRGDQAEALDALITWRSQ